MKQLSVVTTFALYCQLTNAIGASSSPILRSSEDTITSGAVADGRDLIYYGSDAPADLYSWFVRTDNWNSIEIGCGGFLVSPEFVLTAAYCTIHPDVLKIGRGLKIGALCGGFKSPLDHENCDQNYEIKYIDEVLVHPKFRDTWEKENNYALVKLNERSSITPAKLDNGSFASKYEPGKKLWSLGFGNTEETHTTDRLQHIEVEYVDKDECNSHYSYTFSGLDVGGVMCAEGGDLGSGPKFGDFGGPLYDAENDVVVGLVTDNDYWGSDLYMRISDEYAWISNTICDNHSEPKPFWCETIPTATPTHSSNPTSIPTDFTCAETEGSFVLEMMTVDWGAWATSFELYDRNDGYLIDSKYDFWDKKDYILQKCLPCNHAYRMRLSRQQPPRWFTLTVDNRLIATSPSTELNMQQILDFKSCATCDEGGGVTVSLSMLTQIALSDDKYAEIGWLLEDIISGDVIESVKEKKVDGHDGRSGYTGYVMERCLPCSLYKLTYYDTGCAYCKPHAMANVTVDGEIIASKSMSDHYQESIIFSGDNCPTYPTISPITPSPTATPSCSDDELSFNLRFLTDYWAKFMVWVVKDAITNEYFGLSGTNLWSFTEYSRQMCLPCGEYSFQIYNRYGHDIGEFELKVDDTLVASGGEATNYNFTSAKCSPTESPSEGKWAFFMLKKDKQGNTVKKTCNWLRKKSDKARKRLCAARRHQLYSAEEGLAPASITCFETCTDYCPREVGKNKFIQIVDLTGMQGRTFLVKNCKWLKRQNTILQENFCALSLRADDTIYSDASRACPQTCNTCLP